MAGSRLVKIVLRGDIQGLQASMRSASGLVKNTANEITGATREAEKFRGGLSAVGDTAGKIGLVAAAGVGAAIIAYANFDQAMSNVAATGEDARGSLDALREAALEAGARTKFSATEAADAVEALAKAGVSASDILSGGLDGALDLAAAGGLEVAQAAEIAATAMNQFNKTGADVPHIADLLAAAAGKAMGDVEDMGAAFKFVGPVAAQLGVSMEETSGAIALLAQNGVLGEQAGTSLRGMLTSLTSPSKIAADTMDSLGISMYDAQGNFIGLEGLAGQLQERMSGLEEAERNEALGRIFGNEQITAARILYEGGAGAVAEWTKQVDDSGYAAETAARKMDNLKGDAEQLMGALETALIGTGQGADGPLRMAVQSLTLLVDLYNELPGPVKTGAFAVLGLTAALGGTVWAASKAVNGITSARVAATDLGVSFENANKKALALRAGIGAAGIGLSALSGPANNANVALGAVVDTAAAAAIGFAVGGPLGAALGAGATLFAKLAGGSADAAVNMDELTATLDTQAGAITQNTAAWAAKQIQDSGAVSTLADMGISLATATDAVLGNADALEQVAAASKGADFEQVKAIGSVVGLAGAVLDGTDKQRELAAATDESTEAQGAAAGAFGETGDAAADAATEVKAFNDSLNGLLDPLLSQEDASNAWKDSMATLTEEIRKNGATLDDTTTKGRANQDAIRERVKALKDSIAADAEAGVSSEQLEAKMLRGAEGILKTAEAAGLSRGEVKSYLETLGLTPEQITTLFEADSSGARRGAREAKDAINSVPREKVIEIRATAAQAYNSLSNFLGSIPLFRNIQLRTTGGSPKSGRTLSANGGAIPRAAGGEIVGPGTGTSDSIPAIGPGAGAYLLSNGEHVLTAREVNLLGGQDAVYAMRAAIRSQQFAAAYAGGGSVGRSRSGGSQSIAVDGLFDYDQLAEANSNRPIVIQLVDNSGNTRLATLGGR